MFHLGNLVFAQALVGATMVARVFRFSALPTRRLAAALASALLFGAFLDEASWRGLLPLALALAALGLVLRSEWLVGHRHRLAAALAVAVGLWLLVGGRAFSVAGSPFLVLGASYVLFKAVHMLVDRFRGTLLRPSWSQLGLYFFFAPTFLAGPMARFTPFRVALERSSSRAHIALFWSGVYQVVWGTLKCAVLAPAIASWATKPESISVVASPPLQFVLSLFAYSFYLYWDFSGYCDLAIGASALFGIRIPENFRTPYLSRDLAEFWRRWHITLSKMLRDYLYLPLSTALGKRTTSLRARMLGYGGTFLLCGLWHGTEWHFALWGLWHAAGLAALLFFRHQRRARGLSPRILPRWAGVACTFLYVTAGWALFRATDAQLGAWFR